MSAAVTALSIRKVCDATLSYAVIPAKAGIHWSFGPHKMDPRFRGDDVSFFG
jgi:hypothetical protein